MTPTQEAEYIREEAAYDQAVKTFGDSEAAGMWLLRPSNEFGKWITPNQVASTSEEGLANVLAALTRKAVEIGPVEIKSEVKIPGRRYSRRK